MPEQQSKMSITLQNKISRFLKEHGTKSISSSIRQAIIYYGSSSSHFDIQNKVTPDFKNTIMDLLELMDIFDEADMEYTKEKNAFKNS